MSQIGDIIAVIIMYIIFAILIAIFVLYCKWYFIRSAVKAGTKDALKEILAETKSGRTMESLLKENTPSTPSAIDQPPVYIETEYGWSLKK